LAWFTLVEFGVSHRFAIAILLFLKSDMLRPVGELAVLLAELLTQPDSNFADSGDDFNRLFLVDLRDLYEIVCLLSSEQT